MNYRTLYATVASVAVAKVNSALPTFSAPRFHIKDILKQHQNLNILHLIVALLQEGHFLKGIKQKSGEIRRNFHKKSCR